MSNDPLMSLTDVAEVLQTTIEAVRELIRRGDLVAVSRDQSRVAYTELVRYIHMRNHERLTLGINSGDPTDFVLLRPRGD
jgi:hypothetical protein